MPVPKTWRAPSNREFPALPADIYHVFIEDVDVVKTKAYQSEEQVWQLKFTFQLLEDPNKSRKVWKYVTPVISAGGPNKKPANFNLIYEAVFSRTPYQDQIRNINPDVVNTFIGKQLRLTLRKTVSAEGKDTNKIESYLPAKEELPLPQSWTPPVQKEMMTDDDIPVINAEEERTEIDLQDIPF
jgi:hypothetical protein